MKEDKVNKIFENVSIEAVGEQVFFNEPLLIYTDEKHSKCESRCYALGQTDKKRMLMIVFATRGESIRVISARDMSRKERNAYEKNT